MATPRPALAALALAFLLFAGCLAGDPSGEETPSANAGAVAPSEAGNAGASQAEGVAASDSPDLGHQPHMHDYWAGRERVTIFDDAVEPSPEEAVGLTFYNVWVNRQPGAAGGAFRDLPEGNTVYEGTGVVEVTATWTDPTVTGLSLQYRSSESPDFKPGGALESGKPFAIAVSPEMTDLPHMTRSRWGFAFFPEAAPGAAVGSFHVRVEIVKMRDIMLFPAHPDLFEGRPEKVLLDARGESAQQSYAMRTPNLVTKGEFTEHWIVPEHLVPLETASMKVEVKVTKASAQAGEVSEIRLYYRSADTFQPVRAELVEGTMDTLLVYHIPVEPHMVDSPYGGESQWRILVEAATTVTGEEGVERTCGGCMDTEIEFEVKLTAYDHDWKSSAASNP